jgi:hypothetical protein
MYVTPSTRGQILPLRYAAKRAGVSIETLRRLLLSGQGPPAIKRPGSNRWFLYSNEIDAWLDSGRVNQSGAKPFDPTPAIDQTQPSRKASDVNQAS